MLGTLAADAAAAAAVQTGRPSSIVGRRVTRIDAAQPLSRLLATTKRQVLDRQSTDETLFARIIVRPDLADLGRLLPDLRHRCDGRLLP